MWRFFKSNHLTKWAGILVVCVYSLTVFDLKQWENPNAVIASDVKGYYGYLPALFIHNDMSLKNAEVYTIDGDVKIWFSETEEGKRFIKFPAGMAMMYSPFFAIGHITAEWSGHPTNGYSKPYRMALTFGSLLYVLLGVFFFSKLLLRHFSDRVSAATVLVIYFATNLYYYSAIDGVLTHGYSFFLFSAFMYGSVRWLDTNRWPYVFLLGITGGLMVAVRHIDVWFLLFVVAYNVRSVQDLRERLRLFWKHRMHIIVGIILITLMLTPQLLYHWYLFGSVIHYAYSDEGFFFTSPHLIEALFSYRNGWLLYTPIMLFAVIGIFFLRKRAPEVFVASVLGLPIYYYVLASWWCWWFVGFGNRAYINMYPLLAFSLAALIAYLYEKMRVGWVLFNCIILGTIVLNVFQSTQFHRGILHWDSETKEHYWHVFGNSQRRQLQDLLLATPINEAAKRDQDSVYSMTFHTLKTHRVGFESAPDTLQGFKGKRSSLAAFTGENGLFVPVNHEFGAQILLPVAEGATHYYVTAWINTENEVHLAVDAQDKEVPFLYLSHEILQRKGDWKKLHVLAYFPDGAKYSQLLFYVWNPQKTPFMLDQIEAKSLKKGARLTQKDSWKPEIKL